MLFRKSGLAGIPVCVRAHTHTYRERNRERGREGRGRERKKERGRDKVREGGIEGGRGKVEVGVEESARMCAGELVGVCRHASKYV